MLSSKSLYIGLFLVAALASVLAQEEALGPNGQPRPEPYSFSYSAEATGKSKLKKKKKKKVYIIDI